jgi:methyl-accepting chemotaxis protein
MRILGERTETRVLKADVLQSLLRETGSVANQIAKGNIDFKMSEIFLKSELADSFLALKGNLAAIREQESRRNWFNDGIFQINELLRNSQSLQINELLNKSLSKLVRLVDAFQGSIVTISNESNEDTLVIAASFAVDRTTQNNRSIQLGEGLLGQCVLEKSPVYLTDLPSGFFKISSGLGEAKPSTLLIVPMVYREESVGAIELGFFHQLGQHQLEFVNKASEIIAAVVHGNFEKEKMRQILILTQKQADELKAKEEVMQRQMDQMAAMQELLNRSEIELRRRLKETEEALAKEKNNEISKIREEEKLLLESKLDTQRKSYEIIIDRLKAKLQNASKINN